MIVGLSCASYYCLKPFEDLKLRQHVVSIKKTAEVIGPSLAVRIEFLVTTTPESRGTGSILAKD